MSRVGGGCRAFGLALLARPGRERFEVLDRLEVLSGRSWTPPAVAAGRIYLRNRSEMVCLAPRPVSN